MKIFSRISLVAIILTGIFIFPMTANALPADHTVCEDAGCDFTTIAAAVTAASAGQEIEVKGAGGAGVAYDPTGESFTLSIDKDNLTITCTDSPTVGLTGAESEIYLVTGVTIQGCNFLSVLLVDTGAGITITNNTFDTSEMSSIFLTESGPTVTNNTGVNGMYIEGANATIDGNTVRIIHDSGIVGWGRGGIALTPTADGATVDDNTITTEVATFTDNFLSFEEVDNLFIRNNTLSYPTDPTDDGQVHLVIGIWQSSNVEISGNYISTPYNQANASYHSIGVFSEGKAVDNIDILNNTIKMNSAGGGARGIEISDNNDSTGAAMTDVDIKYNIVFSDTDISSSVAGIVVRQVNDSTAMEVFEDYNDTYNVTATDTTNPPTNLTFTQGGHSIAVKPGMMTENAGSTDDLYPFPGSCMFDVDGTTDMGAYSASKRAAVGGKTIINVADSGPVDYSSVDFTSIKDAGRAACYNDYKISVAAGTYLGNVWIAGKGDLILEGEGSGTTTIDSRSNGNSDATLWLNSVDNAIVSGFTLIGDATDTAALYIYNGSDGNTFTDIILSGITSATTSYTKTFHPYSYNSNDYTQDSKLMMFHSKTAAGTDLLNIDENDEDITSMLSTYSSGENWNLGLVSTGGAYYTIYWDDGDYPTGAEALDELSNFASGWTMDCWSDDAYEYNSSDGSYTYNTPTGGTSDCSASTPTPITSGYQSNPSTPAINSFQNGTLYISSSNSNEISSSTIQNSANGVSFSGAAASNTIGSNMTFTSSDPYDIYTSSTGDNTITTSDYCATLNYLVTSTGKLLGCNTAPTVTGLTATQAADETNTVDVGVTIDDPDNDDITIQVQYGSYDGNDCANTAEWTYATLSSVLSTVDTSSGSSTLSFGWNSSSDVGSSDGTYCLRINATDDDNSTTSASTTVIYAYQAPTADPQTGGSSIGAFLSGLAPSPSIDIVDEPADEPTDEEAPAEEEPTDEPTTEEAAPEEELPTETVHEVVVEYIAEPVYEYFTDDEPSEPIVEEPVVEEPIIDQSTKDELIEEYESQETSAKEPVITVQEFSSGSPAKIAKSMKELIEFEEEYTAYTSEGPKTAANAKELEEIIKEEIEKVGAHALDLNKDFVADGVNEIFGVSLTDTNPDGDLLSNAAEFYCGTDPNTADVNDWSKPIVKSLDNAVASSKPAIRVCSSAGDSVDIILVKDSKLAELGQASVFSSNDTSSNEIFVGTATVDDGNKGAITVPTELVDGEYYLFAIGENGTGVANMTVNSEESLKDLTLEVSKENLILGSTVDGLIVLASKANDFEKDDYLNQFAGTADESIILTAEKDTIVYVTIQSRILSSVVIADANGTTKIQDSLIAELPPGTHTFTAYSSDPETNRVSNVISFIFSK
jgi:hypothetical protein